MGWIEVTLLCSPKSLSATSPPWNIGKFEYFWNSFLYSNNYQKPFCVGYGLNLLHLSKAPKFCSSSVPPNEVWPCSHLKYFVKLSHIYQLSIVRLHLWLHLFPSICRVLTSPETWYITLFSWSPLQFPSCVYTTLGNWNAILWEKGITFLYVFWSCFHVKKTAFKCYFISVHPLLGVASHSLFHCALM